MAMLLGRKVGMTQVYDEAGHMLPVTVIEAGPCTVMQVKSVETDGYSAVQMGYDDIKLSRRTMSAKGHADKSGTAPKKFVKEMRLSGKTESEHKLGDVITVATFADNKYLDVIGTSKGKGFAGVMKRHGFGGFPASHGTERRHRAPGSIASYCSDRGHGGNLKKGKRMAGHMGHVRVTTRSHSLISVDAEKNLIVLKGSIPGPAGGYVIVRSSNKR